MNEIKLGAVQERFADIIWELEPVPSGELVKVCAERLNWKKPTTYTVLRALCEKGIFRNKDCVVTSRMSKEEYLTKCSEQFVDTTFGGSLPAFVAAFTKRKSLSDAEIAELRTLIENSKK